MLDRCDVIAVTREEPCAEAQHPRADQDPRGPWTRRSAASLDGSAGRSGEPAACRAGRSEPVDHVTEGDRDDRWHRREDVFDFRSGNRVPKPGSEVHGIVLYGGENKIPSSLYVGEFTIGEGPFPKD